MVNKLVLEAIKTLAPTASTVLTQYLSRVKDISTDEVQIILLSKIIEDNGKLLECEKAISETQMKIIENQGKIVGTQNSTIEILGNHIEHEQKLLVEMTKTLSEVCDSLRNTRADLMRKGLIG